VLASRRGVPGGIVAASLVLEILVTTAGWLAVTTLGWGSLRAPCHDDVNKLRGLIDTSQAIGTLVALAVAICYLASRSSRLRSRLTGLATKLALPRHMSLDLRQLVKAVLFYAVMAVFSGAAFLLIVRSEPSGAAVPAGAVIAANAVAWLAGFFALFAPGGLVVREACLVALLSPWMPAETALVVALAWRLVQIVAEVLCSVVVTAWGLPAVLVKHGEPGNNFLSMAIRESTEGAESYSSGR
jgi:hypothetical protein